MKKSIYLFLLPIVFLMASCIKEKSYTCACTYVAGAAGPSAGQPDKYEETAVKGRFKEDADDDCFNLQSKYNSQFFSGTCLLK